ncbi:hypothetical protein ONZ43_g4920 [Nemania bipapillata]|uniref:Uncharacterized protein n=1 Tax=Nemania bipapillata TaxID=110536 RepID=A0ACC2IGV9_9PEZI|nr:hypothetical protein ONZ43_g4920 [Nemania bipapillata]
MPAQTRSRGKPSAKSSATTVYRSTAAAPKQQEFPSRRRSAKTYGRSKPRKMKQETLTQMDFTSSAMGNFIDLDEDGEEEVKEEEMEEVELEPPKPKARSRSNRRKTAGDELHIDENPRQSKRRKTLGDSPNPSASSSFHTQTLTQMLSTNDRDDDHWQIEDSQDEDFNSVVGTPRKGSRSHIKSEHLEGTESTVPSLINTAHDSSPTPTEKSTAKATPSKRLRFNIPEDKENITPGRTKPKSPKPKALSTGRQPLQEVPDSDEELDQQLEEDLDETEYETEDDEFGTGDPESPTPKRFQNAIPPVENLEPELASPGTASSLLGRATNPSYDISSVLGHEGVASPEPSTEAEADTPRPSRPETAVVSPTPAPAATQGPETAPSEQDENDDAADNLSPSQDFGYTQGLDSQRLPLDSIRALGPQTPHSDIMVSLHPEHIARIVDRTKNHEFRAWKIPQQVSRIWVYITRPESQLKYMCIFGEPKTPGEVEDENGIGNVDFNQGMKAAKFAYEILQVYELNNPVSLDEMKKKGWVAGAPQKYTYIPPAVVGELTANLSCKTMQITLRSTTQTRQTRLFPQASRHSPLDLIQSRITFASEPETTQFRATFSGYHSEPDVVESSNLSRKIGSSSDPYLQPVRSQ